MVQCDKCGRSILVILGEGHSQINGKVYCDICIREDKDKDKENKNK